MKRPVFLAEDDEDDLLFFKEAIQQIDFGVELKYFSDGAQFISGLNNEIPVGNEIIFLDLNMPCKSGIECLIDIRNNVRWKTTPVIILTSSRYQHDLTMIKTHGANFYIRKTGAFNELTSQLKKVFSLSSEELLQSKI